MHYIDPRDQRIAELERLLAAALETICKLEERVKELEAKLNLNSSNSSKPPSSDPPWFRRKYPQKKEKGTRKQGAQKGHRGKSRNLMPIEQVDEVEQHRPIHCDHCGTAFDGTEQEVGEPHRHQVAELPPVMVKVTEHQFLSVCCPDCGETTKSSWPQEVPHSAFGPRLQAVVAYLSGRFRLSRREVSAICKDMFGAEVSVGSVQRCCRNMSEALAEPMEQAESTVKQTAVAHADETGWRQAGSRQWLWVVVTPAVTLFKVAASRGSDVIIQLLGEEYSGGLVTDRWSVYGKLKKAMRQLCWAHIKRDFQGLIDAGGASQQIGERAMQEIKLLFSCWHDYLGERMTRTNFNSTIGLLKGRLKRVFQNGRDKLKEEKGHGLCKNLLKDWDYLWTFLDHPGIEPTNNRAERAIRPAVLWRKGSQGTRNNEGDRFVERMLTVSATCRQHNAPLLDYLTEVCRNTVLGKPLPSLPTTTQTVVNPPMPSRLIIEAA